MARWELQRLLPGAGFAWIGSGINGSWAAALWDAQAGRIGKSLWQIHAMLSRRQLWHNVAYIAVERVGQR
jgi:hypothetical protein